ncbi:uncharacterized protein LOC112592646 [Melanaphis sacchari]|uniref:Transcriptional adapter 3-A n=1 Tax=Melanaphis sacchari TaxID=742174 RepID=A0A2H8TK06_9HEMI|nr:uncharacterized protein LOC112592646 [Melanaphis sacchari]
MSPKKRRGGSRGRGRGIAKRRGPKPRQPLSSDTPTADDTDAEGTSTDGNVSFKQRRSPPQSPTRKKHADYSEERELSLPRLKPTVIPENSTFLSMLDRDNKSDYIMTDDELDHIQWDLEAMLTNVIVRRNTIRDELSTFASMQFARSLHRMAKNPKLPTIRPRAAAEISPVNECRKMKVEFDPTSKELPPSKTESANKFWSLVEPYLAHVKKEDLKWLDDLVKSYSPSKKLYEIPPLGEHYAKTWAKEELEMQKQQSSCSPRPPKKLKFAERIAPDVVELVDKANSAIQDGNVYMPVYQRVVTALLDHSNNSLDDAEENFPEYDDVEEKPQEMSNVCKEFYAEQSVKKQLNKLGLIGRNSKPVPSPEDSLPSLAIADEENDEVLEELNKCDNALAQLREMNKNHLTLLLGRCRKDYYQQLIKNKIEKVNNEILNFKTQQNETWSKEKKIAQMSEEDDELHFLLNQRSNYLGQLQSLTSEFNNLNFSPSISDDSESSDENCEPSNVHIKTEPSENDASVRMNNLINDDCQVEESVEINIKNEIINEKMDVEESNDNNKGKEYDENVVNEEVHAEEIEMTVNEENQTEKDNEVKINQEEQTELQTNVKVNPLVQIKEEESSCSEKFTVERRRRKSKKHNSESEQTSKIESRKPIKIKQEPADYDLELDSSEDIIDGVKRELRPRKLNEPHIYFEPYDGSTSEGSDFTDLSD